MSFHDVRYQLSVTEGLDLGFFFFLPPSAQMAEIRHMGLQIWTNVLFWDETLPGALWMIHSGSFQQALWITITVYIHTQKQNMDNDCI